MPSSASTDRRWVRRDIVGISDTGPCAEFLDLPIWWSPANATLCCKKCIRLRRVHKAVGVQIRENPRTGQSKDPCVPAAVLQIPLGQERKFDIQGDAEFDAPSTAALAL